MSMTPTGVNWDPPLRTSVRAIIHAHTCRRGCSMDWDALRVEIAKATGRPPEAIPRPQTPEFFALMTELGEKHPALHQALTEALVGGIEPPAPTYKELSREAQRAKFRERLLRPFVKQDPTQPRRYRVNRTSITAVMAVGFVALLWIFQMRTSRPIDRAPHGPLPSVQAHSESPPASSVLPASPALVAALPTSPPLPVPPLPSLPTASFALPTAPPGVPVGPGRVREGSAGLQIVAPPGEEPHVTVVAPPSSQSADGPGAPSASQAGTVVLNGLAATGVPGGPSPGGQGAATVHLEIGQQFTVALMTPLAVSNGWQPIPAVAEAQDGPLAGWKIIGQPSLAQDGTTQISWTQALSPDGKTTMPIHGVAYNPKNGVPGVVGVKTVPMTPQAARTVLSGTLAAVGQYVNAQLLAQQVQVSGITATLTTQVPPFWQFAASQLATGFQPAPVQTGGIVLVSQIPAGLPITVFITAPSDPHTGVARPGPGQRG